MDPEKQFVDVVVCDSDGVRMGSRLSRDTALTLVAVVSDDPACWRDFIALWPRYRTPTVPESADGLLPEATDFRTALQKLQRHDSWYVLDLVNRRIISGRAIEPVSRNQVFAMMVNAAGGPRWPLSIHLPPWWELVKGIEAEAIVLDLPYKQIAPYVNREVLFGKPLISEFARRILSLHAGREWNSTGAANNKAARHALTVRVHRDWLMTPRQDLGGRTPRQMLHGAIEWIDRLIEAQQLRLADCGQFIAVPDTVSNFESSPVGREEMVAYFDLCRELINKGWEWCQNKFAKPNNTRDRSQHELELRSALERAREVWLNNPFEDDSPPRFIIECSRRRVPRAAGVQIVGLTERQAESHVADCDCPICIMLAEGHWGVAYTSLDGHHLELDNEFAFSMFETREEWELEQCEFAEMSECYDDDSDELDDKETEDHEFDSVWKGNVSDSSLPGDPGGHMKLAFLWAEVVSDLQSKGASESEVRRFNDHFTEFRHFNGPGLVARGRQLCQELEELALRFPDLVSRVADLQSRVVELLRTPSINSAD